MVAPLFTLPWPFWLKFVYHLQLAVLVGSLRFAAMPPSKYTDAERSAASIATSLALAIRSDYKIAVTVMRNNSETVQHVKMLLTSMGYWPGASVAEATATTSVKQAPSCKGAQVPQPQVRAGPKPSTSLVVVGGGEESLDDGNAVKPKAKKELVTTMSVVGSAVLGDKPKTKGSRKDVVPPMIHRNFVNWGAVGTNIIKHILAKVSPVVCSPFNLKALCTGSQREPSRDAVMELFEFYCNRDLDTAVGIDRQVASLADTFRSKWELAGSYGSDLELPPQWKTAGWYRVSVGPSVLNLAMMTSDHVTVIPLHVSEEGFDEGYPCIQANYSQHRARLVLSPEQTEPAFCTTLFSKSAKDTFFQKLGVKRAADGSKRRPLAIADGIQPGVHSNAIVPYSQKRQPSARPSAAPGTTALTPSLSAPPSVASAHSLSSSLSSEPAAVAYTRGAALAGSGTATPLGPYSLASSGAASVAVISGPRHGGSVSSDSAADSDAEFDNPKVAANVEKANAESEEDEESSSPPPPPAAA